MKNIKIFRFSTFITVAAIIFAYYYGGFEAARTIVFLGILEITLSFDNAVINAKILTQLNKFWREIFLTVGILIAVLGVRLLLPLIIVSITTGMSPLVAFRLAMEKLPLSDPTSYAAKLADSHVQIAMFGGMFLLMVFFDFFLENQEKQWLVWIEKPISKLNRLSNINTIFAITVLLTVYVLANSTEKYKILPAGLIGLLTYFMVSGLGKLSESNLADKPKKTTVATGKTALFLFLYLEVLDASFSFDGVIGAFAITSDPILIMLGLGLIGAIFVRSITIYLVENNTLNSLPYLVNGAHWAIGTLGTLLLISVFHPIGEAVTGTIGLLIVLVAIISSIKYNKSLVKNGG